MKLLLLIVAPLYVLAQPVITRGPIVHYKSDNNATVFWDTDVSSSHITEWGTATGVYTHDGINTRIIRSSTNATYHGWYMTGFPPNTTIFYRVGSGTDGSNCIEGVDCTFSAEQTLTTNAATYPLALTAPDTSWITTVHGGNINAVPPAANGTEWDLAPTGTGRVVNMNASCVHTTSGSTFAQVLTALAALDGTGVMHIRFPGGALCHGQYTLPDRPTHNDWVVVISTATGLAPEGVKISTDFTSYMPTFRSNLHWARRLVGLTGAATTCSEGQGFFNFSITTGSFPLYLCGSGGLTSSPGTTKTVNAFNVGNGQWTTSAAHGYSTGNHVRMTATGTTADNTSFVITVVSTTVFTLDGYTPGGTFDGSGFVIRGRQVTAYNSGNGQFTSTGHGFLSGQVITMPDTAGLTGLGGNIEINVVDANTFTVRNVTIGGTFSGTAFIQKAGDWRNVNDMGILSTSAGAPVGACTDGNYHYNSAAANNYQEGGYLCAGGTWYQYQWNGLSTGGDSAAIRIADGATKYRLVGLNITRSPGVSTDVISRYGLTPQVNVITSLLDIEFTNEDIVIDRCIFEGRGYPERTQNALRFDGARIGLINSVVRNIDMWLSSTVSGNWEGFGFQSSGPGPGVVENNDFMVTGIDMFWPDTAGDFGTPTDYVIRRNKIISNTATMKGHADNTLGLYYFNRHAWECKKCGEMLFTGNEVLYNWSGTNQGAMIAMTPQTSSTALLNLTISSATNGVLTMSTALTPQFLLAYPEMSVRITDTSSAHDGLWKIASASGSTITLANPPVASSTGGTLGIVGIPSRIENVRFQYNTIAHIPTLLIITGYIATSTNNYPPGGFNGLLFDDNIVYDINSSSSAGGGWSAASPGIAPSGELNYLLSTARGTGNIQFTNNTVHGITTDGAHTTNLLFTDSAQTSLGKRNRLDFKNNLMSTDTDTSTSLDGASVGTVGLDGQWVDYFFDGNVLLPTNTSSNKPVGSPANVYTGTEASIGWRRVSANDYRLQWDSPYFGTGKGANMTALKEAQGEVRNVRVRRINSSPVLSYQKPDTQECFVEYGTSATWGTGTRVGDGGGTRYEDVSVTLTGGTDHIRLMCAVEKVACTDSSGVFICTKE